MSDSATTCRVDLSKKLNCAIEAGTRRQEGTLFLQQPWQAGHQQVRGGSTLRKLMVRILDLHIFPMTT